MIERSPACRRGLDHLHLAKVFAIIELRSRLIPHKCAGHKIIGLRLRQLQCAPANGVINEITEAGIHIHRRRQAGRHGALHMRGETGPIRIPVFLKRE